MEAIGQDVRALAGKYLTFTLKGEVYGLEILKVQEIMGLLSVTHVPRTPDFIRGVINLRGRVIPVLDLRLKFGLEATADTERTCIIVVQTRQHGSTVTIGIIVDEVSEVISIGAEQIEAPPSFGTNVDTAFIMGLGKTGGKVIMLLDVNRVLSGEDESLIAQAAASAEA